MLLIKVEYVYENNLKINEYMISKHSPKSSYFATSGQACIWLFPRRTAVTEVKFSLYNSVIIWWKISRI